MGVNFFFMRAAWVGLLCAGSLFGGERVRLPDGTPVPVRLKDNLRSERAQVGDRVEFEVGHPVTIRDLIAIPEGALAWGAVQGVKKNKEIKFDLQRLRLPNLQEIRLRSVRKDTDNPGKDIIKIDTNLGTFVGAMKATEFVAYVDGDVDVEATSPEAKPASGTGSAAAGTPAPSPPVAAPPARAVSTAPAAPIAAEQTVAPNAAALGPVVERVTVECFSIPFGAEILIDGEFYGHTPSILKLTAAPHNLQLHLRGHQTFSQVLNLVPGAGIITVRAALEQR